MIASVVGVVTPGVAKVDKKGRVTEFSTGITANARVTGITAGPDGNLWFGDGVSIGRITPKGKVTEFSTGITAGPNAIVAGPDGNLWFTEDDQIGRIGPGKLTQPRGRHGPTLPGACPRKRGSD